LRFGDAPVAHAPVAVEPTALLRAPYRLHVITAVSQRKAQRLPYAQHRGRGGSVSVSA
jgi:hypothetical protein